MVPSLGLQAADADDVAQDVLTKLTEKMASFRYDQSRCFRAWLKTITQRVLSDLMASRRRALGSQACRSSRPWKLEPTSSGGSRRSSTASCSTWQSREFVPGSRRNLGCLSSDRISKNAPAPKPRGYSRCRSHRSSWPSIACRKCSRPRSASWRRGRSRGLAYPAGFRAPLGTHVSYFSEPDFAGRDCCHCSRAFARSSAAMSVETETKEIVGTTPSVRGC